MSSATATALKTVLRQEMRKILSDLPAETVRRESKIVTDIIFSIPEYQMSSNISIYTSLPKGEINTRDLIKDALEQGKSCYVPRCNPQTGIMDMVKLVSYDDYLSLPLNHWGIPEPGLDEERIIANELDMIIMPGLAFDHKKNRLGHGKGFYDRYLAKYKTKIRSTLPKTVALALDVQVLNDGIIPTDQYDQKPDFILSASKQIV
ncbi:3696_t:CDS:2 [Paraglomus brasilianum]|uniref:5-formyltetrahydrofolate cyclo-ligase n=1 Tax=Paraglomus brasilianum TaxID=144538 RepID=A0A9N9C5H9_9GLOM|nr:3696_t:CDS:2 [Paraglomus brasilianum]